MRPEMGKFMGKVWLKAKIRETTYRGKVVVSLSLCPAGFACRGAPRRERFPLFNLTR
jgi:hypothetical protein